LWGSVRVFLISIVSFTIYVIMLATTLESRARLAQSAQGVYRLRRGFALDACVEVIGEVFGIYTCQAGRRCLGRREQSEVGAWTS
jgi:hypothetical protein